MKIRRLFLSLAVMFLPVALMAQSEIISRIDPSGLGKQRATIYGESAHANWNEHAIYMFMDNNSKWCDNSTSQPWMILQLSDYYNVDRFVISDGHPIEPNYSNFAEYKIWVTDKEPKTALYGYSGNDMDWDETDWVEVVHGVDVGDQDVKDETITPIKARYIRFQILDKGINPSGSANNACRVYGFDIYGQFAEAYDYGRNVSAGKSIFAYYCPNGNNRETPLMMIDGNLNYIVSKWCFGAVTEEYPFRWAVIDLEKEYDIDMFALYDARSAEADREQLYGCNVYVSEWAPDVNLITATGDENDCWTKVVDSNDEEYMDIKEYYLSSPVKGRFVKLEIPMEKISNNGNATTRIFEFEVYGDEAAVAANDATLSLLTVTPSRTTTPSFSGNITSYTVNVDKEVDTVTIAAAAMHANAVVTGAGVKQLNIGSNVFTIEVTAADGVTKQTYTVDVVRAALSKIATLSKLSINRGWILTKFDSATKEYDAYVPYESIGDFVISAAASDAGATIVGAGAKELTDLTASGNSFELTVTAEDNQYVDVYTLNVYVLAESLISVSDPNGHGKRIVNIHSCSGKVNDTENPYKLLIGERLNTSSTNNKWCGVPSGDDPNPWVIFSLSDIYYIDRVEFRDGQYMSDGTNISEYSVYATTKDINSPDFDPYYDWEEVLWRGGESSVNIKGGSIGADARFLKFSPVKADGTNSVWIYGFDIYGEYLEPVNRGGVISVGKTIVDHHNHWSDRETPANIVDGNINIIQNKTVIDEYTGEDIFVIDTVKCEPWAFNMSEGAGWVTIDLEDNYDVTGFKVYDTNDWIRGYQVSLSANGDDWSVAATTPIYTDSADLLTDPKVLDLSAPVRARYVRLEVPKDMLSTNFNRLREFEVYGSPVTALPPALNKAKTWTIGNTLVQSGNPVKINGVGEVKVYSLQGILMGRYNVSGSADIPTSRLISGCYIIECSGAKGTQQAKLIVK